MIVDLESRFSAFSGEEKELLRMALRRLADDLYFSNRLPDNDYEKSIDLASKVAALVFEVVNCNKI